MTDKFPEELRTFETRLAFIKELFENKYTQQEIMAKCIEHKLDRSFLEYNSELKKSLETLKHRASISVLKHLD